MNRFDGEIGRGRRPGNGSSSSRESSEERSAPKRSFTPTGSDDENAVVPSTNSSTAGEPAAPQPLLRQAMAFRTDNAPESIVTYEAQPPAPPKKFLPGQQVPITAPKKTKKDKAPKRPRKLDAYPGQTTRFRIATYDPTPSNEPPINQGTGPYSSMYRGAAPQPRDRPPSPVYMPTASTSNSFSSGSMHSSRAVDQANPPNHVTHFFAAPIMGEPQAHPPPPRAPPQIQPQLQSMQISGQGQSGPSGGYAGSQQAPMQHLSNPPNSNQFVQQQQQQQQQQPRLPPLTRASSQNLGQYYRVDYERRVWAEDPTRSPPRKPSGRNGVIQQPQQPQQIQQQPVVNNPNPAPSKIEPERRERLAQYPVRMVTIFIHDVRSGTTDGQLAEVRASLRPNDSPEEGFWADAKEICDRLQEGPCRIDGPARAYTLRGRYRQIILRVSPNNEDFTFSTNVHISAAKTLDIIVEMLPSPGSRPEPPFIPPEIFRPQYDDEDINDQEMDYEPSPPPPPPPRRQVREPESHHYNERTHEQPREWRVISREHNSHDRRRSRERREPVERDDSRERRERGERRDQRDQRKRINSPSFDDYDEPDTSAGPSHPVASKLARRDYDYENSPRQSPRHHSPRSPTLSAQEVEPPKRRRNATRGGATRQQASRGTRQKSPAALASQAQLLRPPPTPPNADILYPTRPDEEMTVIHAEFMLALKEKINLDDKKGFLDFFRAKSGNRVCDVYSRYQYFKKNCSTYIGKRLDKFDLPITEKHLVQILRLDNEPDFLDDYKETMRLMPLYYAEDPGHVIRYLDPRVPKLLQDTTKQPMQYQPSKELLKLLRDLNDAYEKDSLNKHNQAPTSSPTTTSEPMSVDGS